jgi:cytochrome c553
VRQWIKTALKGAGGLVGLAALGLGAYVLVQVRAFDASMDRVYDVPVASVAISSDADVLARGKHLAESVAPCAASACHGSDFAGGETIEMGPVATLIGSNVTKSIVDYSDGELARLLHHGIKKDGRSLAFMPVQDFAWLPDDDVAAIVSYLRTLPVLDKVSAPSVVKTLGKVLDRNDKIILDVARRIDHTSGVRAKGATPTVEYGRFLARGCQGCHGDRFSGGPIPGAPASMPTPLNLTPHETGLRDWSFDDFNKLLNEGVKKNGKRLDPFMPYASFAKFDDIERRALWSFLKSLPPMPFGSR